MPSEGPRSPGTVVNDASAGATAWSSPGDAAASDDARANANDVSDASPSQILLATSFGFAIPAGSTIDGIVVEIERRRVNINANTVRDFDVRLVKGGVRVGEDKASGTNWPTTEAIAFYGSGFDLWGTTWSAAEVNASNFGIALQAGGTDDRAEVDHMRITVHYTEGSVDPVYRRQRVGRQAVRRASRW